MRPETTSRRIAGRGWATILARAGCCLLLLAGSQSLACRSNQSKPRSAPKTLAVVNGEVISIADFQKTLNTVKEAGGKGFFSAGERAGRIKSELLERMIDVKLLLQEARKRRIVLDPKLVDASLQLIFDQYPPGGVEEELLKKSKSLQSYRQETQTSLLVHKLLKREVVDRIAVSTVEIESYFNKHPNEFREPEQVRVRQIVTKTEETASQIRKQILRGEKFEALARKHSLGPEGKDGGDLGYFARGIMPPAIEEECFKLWSAHVSRVVPSPYGFHLFQLVDRRPARELDLDTARPRIERKIMEQKTREAESYYIRTLRDAASIERDLGLLDQLH